MAEFKGFVDHDVHPTFWCPYCRQVMDGAMGITGENAPEEGDASICFYCAKVAVFTGRGHLVKPTEEQLSEFMSDEEIAAAVELLEEYLDRHPDIDRRSMT